MEQGIQDYLRKIAIKTKIENFKEFDKSKEETVEAIVNSFQLSLEEATVEVERYWELNSLEVSNGGSLLEKLEYYKQEKARKIQEYDIAIGVVKDAINGYSIEKIATQKGLSIEKVKMILE